MFDVITEEIEVIINDGLANLYWCKGERTRSLVETLSLEPPSPVDFS